MTELIAGSDKDLYEKLRGKIGCSVTVLKKTRYKGSVPCLTGKLIAVENTGKNKVRILSNSEKLGGPNYGEREVEINDEISFSI